MKISVVTTLYNSSSYIDEFYRRMKLVLTELTSDFEFIFVNDGSPDNSLQKALNLYENDLSVRIIDLSRNFGHHQAIMEGLRHSTGDYIFLIDCDLEELPEWLITFNEMMTSQNVDAVVGKQNQRNGGRIKRFGGDLFYKIFNFFSNVEVPPGVTITRLMSRRYVDALVSHNETELFFAGLCQITGFNQAFVTVDKGYKGRTSYSTIKRLNQAVDAITSFSSRPLYFIFIFGSLIFLFSILAIFYIFVQKFFFSLQAGYASLIASIWAVGGVLMMCTGVIGIYLGKIFSEVKDRPVIVRQVFESNNDKKNPVSRIRD